MHRVFFHRHFGRFSGGHLKLYDYSTHVDASGYAESYIYIDPNSHASHLWKGHPRLMDVFEPEMADVLFLAGGDWNALDRFPGIEERIPVLNLIQGIRHADPKEEQFSFLSRKATRICVSYEVAEAIRATGKCNGPVQVIENGIHMPLFDTTPERTVDVLIVGLKQPDLACRLADRIAGLSLKVDCLADLIPRDDLLQKMSRSRIVVTLPKRSEGFYLPALEAMSLGCAVVCPDCIGNRGFCVDEVTCLMPEYTLDGLEKSVTRLLRENGLMSTITGSGMEKVMKFNLSREREEFLLLFSHILGIAD